MGLILTRPTDVASAPHSRQPLWLASQTLVKEEKDAPNDGAFCSILGREIKQPFDSGLHVPAQVV